MKGLAYALPLVAFSATAAFGAGERPSRFLSQPDRWFGGDEARRIATNILFYQSDLGGWPKNTDTTSTPFRGDRKQLKPTFDNGATTDEWATESARP